MNASIHEREAERRLSLRWVKTQSLQKVSNLKQIDPSDITSATVVGHATVVDRSTRERPGAVPHKTLHKHRINSELAWKTKQLQAARETSKG